MRKTMIKTLGLAAALAMAAFGSIELAQAATTCALECRNGLAYYCCTTDGVKTCTYKPNIDCRRN